jgi:hypothetical protein
MRPDPANGRRSKIVIISGISSAQVLGHYATANVLRCAWVGEAKTLTFALGERGIHVNTLSLGGTLAPWYRASLEKRAATAGVTFEQRLAEETSNIPLRKYGEPDEVGVAVEGLLSAFSDHMDRAEHPSRWRVHQIILKHTEGAVRELRPRPQTTIGLWVEAPHARECAILPWSFGSKPRGAPGHRCDGAPRRGPVQRYCRPALLSPSM